MPTKKIMAKRSTKGTKAPAKSVRAAEETPVERRKRLEEEKRMSGRKR
jgi:hypothetical protein